MSKNYVELYYHFVWSTWRRSPFMIEEIQLPLYRYMMSVSRTHSFKLFAVNGIEDHIHVVGIAEQHHKYGEQVVANEISHCPISIDLLKDFLTLGSGIGDKIAERLIIRFGDELVNLIENRDIDKLSSVNKVSKSLAITICNSWHKQAGKLKLIQFILTIV